jgi:hypothetical protein
MPDYSKSALDLFKLIAKQYINRRNNLDIICYATFLNHIPIPSWVPSWSWYDPGLSMLPEHRLLGTRYESMYRCCGDLELDRELLLDPEVSDDRLWLAGFKFDAVSVLGSVASKVQDLGLELPRNGPSDLLKEWKSLSEIYTYAYWSNVEETFQRTLVADAIGGEKLKVADVDSQSSVEKRLDHKVDLLEESMKRATMKRTFFITKKGDMGLGPSSMEEGDLVCILLGG